MWDLARVRVQCWGVLTPAAQGGGVEGPLVHSTIQVALPVGTAVSLPAPTPGIFPHCEASTLQREEEPQCQPQAVPQAFPYVPWFCFQHPQVGIPQPRQAVWQWWQSRDVGASSSQLPMGTVMGGCLKKHLALPQTKPTEAGAHSWAP